MPFVTEEYLFWQLQDLLMKYCESWPNFLKCCQEFHFAASTKIQKIPTDTSSTTIDFISSFTRLALFSPTYQLSFSILTLLSITTAFDQQLFGVV